MSEKKEIVVDPYKEMEIYLQKAQNEIGQIFVDATTKANRHVTLISSDDVIATDDSRNSNGGVRVLARLEAFLHALSRTRPEPESSLVRSRPGIQRRDRIRAQSETSKEGREGVPRAFLAAKMDALTAWVDNLVDEMNNIGNEEKSERERKETLVSWLLSDLGVRTTNGSASSDEEDSRKDSKSSHVSRLSSNTSTLSSTGSQMKPEDVQDFLRRVETSIWESESLKRRKKTENSDGFVNDAATQTTPCLSRTCSTIMDEPVDTVSCSSVDVLSVLSVASSFGEDHESRTKNSDDTKMGENSKPDEIVWVKRENSEIRTKFETRSDSNIAKVSEEKKRLVLRTPLSAPTSAAPSPVSETGPKGPVASPDSRSPTSVLVFDIAPKSSSAPVLDARNLSLPNDDDDERSDRANDASAPSSPALNDKVVPRLRSQSVKELTELEAVEACNWLRAAGFPQYVQMFEDSQFPINIAAVQKDHYFLDTDSLQSLFRRLNTLNKCARMRLDNIPRKSSVEDSDDEDQCALSENWTFQRQSRRWSRIPYLTVGGQLPNGHKPDGVQSTPSNDADGGSDKAPDTPPDGRCSGFKRSGSDRLKDGARAFLRRMESFKTKRSKRRNREAVVISGPSVVDTDGMDERVQQLSCVDLATSPQTIRRSTRSRSMSRTDDSDNNNSSSQSSTPSVRAKRADGWFKTDADSMGLSDPECSPPISRSDTNHFNVRTGSFHSTRKKSDKNAMFETKRRDSESNATTNRCQTTENNGQIIENSFRKWSLISDRFNATNNSFSINSLSVGQLMILKKLALLKLTALMERYSPSNRSGWSWMMPKFIKRMKNPDYKDKVVFGVPLSVVYQRTGQPLPLSIQEAILFLKKNAVDAVGIFRKSGVRSRIHKLKMSCETNPNDVSFEGQQTYDVADMLKQYFRELPEALLTNKMSETFITIYQYIPDESRLEALQAAIVLIPDENREILQKLLTFLYQVSLQARENQMTASNLAVCFAPSLFHTTACRGSSNSPRRRKTVGVPDQKELNENRAAHDCLSFMIREHGKIFSVSEDAIYQCRFSHVDDAQLFSADDVISLNNLEGGNWKSYVQLCIQSLLKECRDKAKGWMNVATHENAELSFKKVDDGNPLRMWKVSVEVEAPPIELLNRVLRERHLWDEQLVKWRVVYKLDSCSEVFNYVRTTLSPLPARDYCILRSWRTDLPKGACVLVESSITLSESALAFGDVRGVVMFSRYLIEPCGSGKSRVTHISRVDTRGRSLEWYNRIYGHMSALHLLRLGNSFRHNAEGPESKV